MTALLHVVIRQNACWGHDFGDMRRSYNRVNLLYWGLTRRHGHLGPEISSVLDSFYSGRMCYR